MNTNKTNAFEDFKINIKVKLSALWASVTLCYLYGDYFELYVPQKVKGLISGENLLDSPQKLFFATLTLAIPALMVCLTIILKPSINRVLNLVFGLLFTAIMTLIAFTSMESWRLFYVFLAIIESILTALIVWYAYNWPRQTKIDH
jgi:hypothetical protein